MKLAEFMLDMTERMARVEEKVDSLHEDRKTQYAVKVQVILAMVGSATAIGLAVFL